MSHKVWWGKTGNFSTDRVLNNSMGVVGLRFYNSLNILCSLPNEAKIE
uniref:Uncharacterized protein n=1 Tax=Ciona intestinalis TaxID=7719 RepID=H2XJW5_CIOIN